MLAHKWLPVALAALSFSMLGSKFALGQAPETAVLEFRLEVTGLASQQSPEDTREIEQRIAAKIAGKCNAKPTLPWQFTADENQEGAGPWKVKIVLHEVGSRWDLDIRMDFFDEETEEVVERVLLTKILRGPNDPHTVPAKNQWPVFFAGAFADQYLGIEVRSVKARELRDELKWFVPIAKGKVFVADRSTDTRLVGALLLHWDQFKRWSLSGFVMVCSTEADEIRIEINSKGINDKHLLQVSNASIDAILVEHKQLNNQELGSPDVLETFRSLRAEGWIYLDDYVPPRNTGGLPIL